MRQRLRSSADALRAHPDNLEMIDHAISVAVASGAVTTALEICERRDVLSPQTTHGFAPWVRQLSGAIDARLFSEHGVGNMLHVLSDVQRAEGFRTAKVALSSDPTDGSFLYNRFIHSTPGEASSLNERLANRIADHPDLLTDPGLDFVVLFTGSRSPDGRIP